MGGGVVRRVRHICPPPAPFPEIPGSRPTRRSVPKEPVLGIWNRDRSRPVPTKASSSLDGFEAAMSNKFGRGHAGLWDSPCRGCHYGFLHLPGRSNPAPQSSIHPALGCRKSPPDKGGWGSNATGEGAFMARKDGGESEGIVLYPSRSPSLGWKPTPLAPLVRG